eukprot:5563900-Pleurochrysis_carterae.AAC.1
MLTHAGHASRRRAVQRSVRAAAALLSPCFPPFSFWHGRGETNTGSLPCRLPALSASLPPEPLHHCKSTCLQPELPKQLPIVLATPFSLLSRLHYISIPGHNKPSNVPSLYALGACLGQASTAPKHCDQYANPYARPQNLIRLTTSPGMQLTLASLAAAPTTAKTPPCSHPALNLRHTQSHTPPSPVPPLQTGCRHARARAPS